MIPCPPNPPIKRIVVLISGSGTNLQALIDHAQLDTLSGQIVAVVSNRPDVMGLKRAAIAGIPARTLDHHHFSNRTQFDRALMTLIDSYHPDLVVLAGFMRILTPDFVRHYHGRMLNIHPSLLPLYPGLHTHQRALEARDRQHGSTVHFVTEELDGGPLIIRAKVPVLPEDTAETLQKRVLEQEHRIYPLAVSWFCQGRLSLRNHQAHFDSKPMSAPFCVGDTQESLPEAV
jgi:phosphoribosylglycinamide formyltransferase-1